jgi:5-methylcytosine-specific restriction endonuclease McrA
MSSTLSPRADRSGPHRIAFDKNKRIILKTRNTCGICGQPVDKSLKYPHPLSPVIDHIVPINKNGHPSDINNLQLAHWQCNRQKSDKLYADDKTSSPKIIGNRNLPQTIDWFSYKS